MRLDTFWKTLRQRGNFFNSDPLGSRGLFLILFFIVLIFFIFLPQRAKIVTATFSNANQEKKIKIISLERCSMNEERVEKRKGPKKAVELFDEQWACSKSSDSLSQFQTNERIRSNSF